MRWPEAAVRECKRICVHEAAHAVAIITSGGQASVSLIIRRDADDAYFFSGVTSERRRHPADAATSALVAAAGPVAEMRYAEERGYADPPESAFSRDMQNVDEASLDPFPFPPLPKYGPREAAMERARAVLEDPDTWWAVLRLADALATVWPDREASCPGTFEGYMSAAEVWAVCAQAGLRAQIM